MKGKPRKEVITDAVLVGTCIFLVHELWRHIIEPLIRLAFQGQ